MVRKITELAAEFVTEVHNFLYPTYGNTQGYLQRKREEWEKIGRYDVEGMFDALDRLNGLYEEYAKTERTETDRETLLKQIEFRDVHAVNTAGLLLQSENTPDKESFAKYTKPKIEEMKYAMATTDLGERIMHFWRRYRNDMMRVYNACSDAPTMEALNQSLIRPYETYYKTQQQTPNLITVSNVTPRHLRGRLAVEVIDEQLQLAIKQAKDNGQYWVAGILEPVRQAYFTDVAPVLRKLRVCEQISNKVGIMVP